MKEFLKLTEEAETIQGNGEEIGILSRVFAVSIDASG